LAEKGLYNKLDLQPNIIRTQPKAAYWIKRLLVFSRYLHQDLYIKI